MEPTIVNEEEVITPQTTEETVTEPVPLPGEKTESALLLESLQKERAKRKELEAELALKNTAPVGYSSDEAIALKAEIDRVSGELASSNREKQLSQIQATYPALKDKAPEFEQFLEENPGIKLDTAAKAFLVEKDLIQTQPRKGLEKDIGGGRTPVKVGMTSEEKDELRVTNYREYVKRIKNGTLN